MEFEREDILDGRVYLYRLSGTLTQEGIDEMMRSRYHEGVPQKCKAYILDMSAADFEGTGKQEILWLAEKGARYRSEHGDARTTILVTPANLQFGIARMLKAYAGGGIPLQVYRTMEEALEAAESIL